jgi:organic hydroperoxide reductase OsmC/OhrA
MGRQRRRAAHKEQRMSEYRAIVEWKRNGAIFTDNKYSRGHRWLFDGGIEVPASSSPHSVRLPFSVENAVDPEEALVAALSSCHMLTFLYLAAKKKFVVESYRDDAVGFMEKNEQGRMAITRVTLRPEIIFSSDVKPSASDLVALHHGAHEECYIANSVKTEVRVEPVTPR